MSAPTMVGLPMRFEVSYAGFMGFSFGTSLGRSAARASAYEASPLVSARIVKLSGGGGGGGGGGGASAKPVGLFASYSGSRKVS